MKPSNILVFRNESVGESATCNGKKRSYGSLEASLLENINCYHVKVTDLVACAEKGSSVNGSTLSCTAKFIAPEVAQSITRGESFVASEASFVWALGMTLLQIFDLNYQALCPSIGLLSAAEIYDFYTSKRKDEIQTQLDDYTDKLFTSLRSSIIADSNSSEVDIAASCLHVLDVETESELNIWIFLIKKMLHADPCSRSPFCELLTIKSRGLSR
jgi:serine/threonine protein kinase